LDLFVAPYKCISNRTGLDKTLGGIIECVPNSHSRDQLGKAFEIDLYQYFLKKFGSEYSNEFKLARLNFIKSLSSYSVVSYILQIKDRHNGNIMIDDWGHIIHIDFGFIFDWSPGKDMRFESADFKLTKEFIDIVGGDQQAEAYQLYVTKTVQAYIAVRQHYPIFRNLIQLMHLSGFPCFKEQSLQKLEERFRLDLQTDLDAANHMRTLIDNAHDKWSTKFYDRIQYLQNKIVF
jgi:phosphatidylinositol 4-kinase A